MPWGGRPQGAPLPLSSQCKVEGHPQGAPLPIVFSRRYGRGRGPQGGLSFLGVMPWGGEMSRAPQGAPLPIVFSRRYGLGRAPTRGAPTDCLLSALWPGEGAHKGRPYRLSSLGVMAWGGHPQGAPLPIAFFVMPWGGHPQGAPLPIVLLSALCPGEGAHKGRPYPIQAASRGFVPI